VDPRRFDAFARDYDRFVALDHDDAPWLRTLGLGGERALDAGCGSGRETVFLAERYEHVVGVDISAPLLEVARSRPHPRVEYVLGDLRYFTDGDGFDLVYSHATLHHVGDYRAALEHLRSLLRPGGTAVLVDVVSDRRPTPPRRAYVAGAIASLVPDVVRLGPRDAWWLLRFRTSRPWLAHLLTDRFLSRAQFRALYGEVFPGARFVDRGYALAAIWSGV
jgi:SAM-dependent methyltransferase